MDFDAYDLDSAFYDEMFLPDGTPHAHCLGLHESLLRLPVEELVRMQERVTHSFSSEGITFTVYGGDEAGERIMPVDCLPRILPAEEWRQLEAGLGQRLQALNRFLADVYGPARIVDDGVVPVDLVRGCPQYRVEMRGAPVPHGTYVAVCGTDLVRTNEGFHVLEDNLRVPSGVSYMVANRKAVKANLRRLYRSCRVREVEHYGRLLRETLKELAPRGEDDPCVVLLTPGVYNAAFYEHIYLAHEIGATLVEGRDL
ncbi:MAG: circularly permuted type 2 ATP-grasp protein, partial [Gemmatimonadota bacterium]|nr:circularly permuted type 2 ATP-grasp protein [Gemmatimonadota bacterium]